MPFTFRAAFFLRSGAMLWAQKKIPLDAHFDDKEFEQIFLHNHYPTHKARKVDFTGKAELWALFAADPVYHGLNLLRSLRSLRGIHTDLRIGPRSKANAAVRGICRDTNQGFPKTEIWFEGYAGNIADATRTAITIAPYDHSDKSRALSQKFFVRLIIPMADKKPLEKIDALLLAYTLALLLDNERFVGIVDTDLFLFVPPAAVRAGVSNYYRHDRLLNTHLIYGFNHFEQDDGVCFFTHGLNRFAMPDIVVLGSHSNKLTRESYRHILRAVHARFLAHLTRGKLAALQGSQPLAKNHRLPEQVAAMMGKKIVLLTDKQAIPQDEDRIVSR